MSILDSFTEGRVMLSTFSALTDCTSHAWKGSILVERSNPVADRPIASKVFLRAIEQIAGAFRQSRKPDTSEPSIQAIEAVRKKQTEHEERKRRISEEIANGARIGRNL